jgi:hypothetical protein
MTNRKWICCVLLAVVTLAVYSPVVRNGFVNADDKMYVVANRHIRHLNWQTAEWAVTNFSNGYPTPLTWMSHALDYAVYGLNPAGHHITNVLLHTINVLLLFLLLTSATKRAGPSLFVAALFALHPLNVEAVAWIAERKTVLSMMFFLLTLAAYGWYTRRPGVKRYLAVIALFALGLVSKPMVITLPCVLLLLDFWPLKRFTQYPFWKLVLEKMPLIPFVVASAWVSIVGQRPIINSVGTIPLALRARIAVVSEMCAYPLQMLRPTQLVFSDPWIVPEWLMVVLSLVLLLGVSLLVWWQRRARPYLLVGLFWYLGTMVPMSSIIFMGPYTVADRYMYLPMIGLFVALVWLASEKINLMPVAAVVLIILSALTWRQISFWKSSAALWQRHEAIIRIPVPGDRTLDNEQRVEQAERDVARDPQNPAAHVALGDALSVTQDRPMDEIKEYKTALALTSAPEKQAVIFDYLANADVIYGLDDEATANFNHMSEIYRQLPPSEIAATLSAVEQYVAAHPATKEHVQISLYWQMLKLQEVSGRKEEAQATLDQIKQFADQTSP